MGYGPEYWIYVPWVAWAGSWTLAALWANRTVTTPGGERELPYRIFTLSGFLLLLVFVVKDGKPVAPASPEFLFHYYWSIPLEAQWAMVGAAALGFLFCWWARIHLGRLWSGSITRKDGHRVVDSGPYGIVRHPIYTGLLTAGLATMVLKGTGHAIIGFALMVIGYHMKARLEERFLRDQLGAADYDAYARRVPMLVPFSPV